LLKLNPMEHFATVFRNLLYDNRFPALSDTVVCVLCAAAAAAIGVVVFSRFEGRLAEEL
jgi:ABC-type polysaccharide/polyol phosphate export permease